MDGTTSRSGALRLLQKLYCTMPRHCCMRHRSQVRRPRHGNHLILYVNLPACLHVSECICHMAWTPKKPPNGETLSPCHSTCYPYTALYVLYIPLTTHARFSEAIAVSRNLHSVPELQSHDRYLPPFNHSNHRVRSIRGSRAVLPQRRFSYGIFHTSTPSLATSGLPRSTIPKKATRPGSRCVRRRM
jgi:hypothetical protein